MKDAEGVQFLQWCLPRLRLVWPGYRKVRRQIYKRLNRRLESLGLVSLAEYRTYLDAHPEEWKILDTSCWISISHFYRDKGVFQFLEQEVVPDVARHVLATGERVLRCWSLGCASGEEPYTLAILWKLALEAQFPEIRLVILATDIDVDAIARAQRGCYSWSSLKDLPVAWRDRAFDRTDGELILKPEFREPVTFLVQDIRKQAPDDRFHLVLCRYLALTYFDEALQREILARIVERMHEGGALVVGNRETLPPGNSAVQPWAEKWGVYRNKSCHVPPPL